MSLHHEPSPAPKGSGWLASYRDSFLTELAEFGYAARTINNYQSAIDGFCARIEARGLNVGEIGTELAATQERKEYIKRFVAHLIDAGVMPAASPTAPPALGPLDGLSLAYGDWLHHQQGLSPKTISIRQRVLKRFLTFRFDCCPTGP